MPERLDGLGEVTRRLAQGLRELDAVTEYRPGEDRDMLEARLDAVKTFSAFLWKSHARLERIGKEGET